MLEQATSKPSCWTRASAIAFSGAKCALAAIKRRPWTVDILSGAQLAGISVFFRLDPLSVIDRAAYSFLDRIPVGVLEDVMFLTGVFQIVAGMAHKTWARMVMAVFAIYLYSVFAFGLHYSDAHAATVIPFISDGVANFLILIRLF